MRSTHLKSQLVLEIKDMLIKTLKLITAIGIFLSFISLSLVLFIDVSEAFRVICDKIFLITKISSCLFLITISQFINQKFNRLLRVIGAIILSIVILNLFSELNIFKIDNIELVILILFSSIYIMYVNFVLKKQNLKPLNYLKMALLTFVFFNAFLIKFKLNYDILEFIIQLFYWLVIIISLIKEYDNNKINSLINKPFK